MIELHNVAVGYDGTPIVEDVTLTIPDRGLTVLIGSNGAGKSTLLSGVGRLNALLAGEIIVDGRPLEEWSNDELAKQLAILKQSQDMQMRLKVFELILLGRFPYSKGRYSEEDYQVVQDVMAQMELTALADRYIDELSGGQKQRAFIAMTLAQETKYLLLDEPIASLDMRFSRDMMRYLQRVTKESDKSVVVIIHDLNLALAYADHVIAMTDGRVIAHGPVDEIVTPATIEQIYGCEVTITDIHDRKIVLPDR